MTSISKSISKPAPLKLREMTPIQRILARKLIGSRWEKLHSEARADADRDCDFDRDCDVTPEACSMTASEVPKSKKDEFAESFGDSLVVDASTIDVWTWSNYDSSNKRIDGVTVQETDDKGTVVSKTFVPTEEDEPDDTEHGDEEMVAVPYACGKGVTMHAWVAKKVAGDMMGH
jgi:hypothetical protein